MVSHVKLLRSKRDPVHIPFKELTECPACFSTALKKVHDQKYPSKQGIIRFVIYRCSNGHETSRDQLVVKQFNVPPKEKWDGWT